MFTDTERREVSRKRSGKSGRSSSRDSSVKRNRQRMEYSYRKTVLPYKKKGRERGQEVANMAAFNRNAGILRKNRDRLIRYELYRRARRDGEFRPITRKNSDRLMDNLTREVCRKRSERRRTLFSLRKVGKGGGRVSTNRTFTELSRIICS